MKRLESDPGITQHSPALLHARMAVKCAKYNEQLLHEDSSDPNKYWFIFITQHLFLNVSEPSGALLLKYIIYGLLFLAASFQVTSGSWIGMTSERFHLEGNVAELIGGDDDVIMFDGGLFVSNSLFDAIKLICSSVQARTFVHFDLFSYPLDFIFVFFPAIFIRRHRDSG